MEETQTQPNLPTNNESANHSYPKKLHSNSEVKLLVLFCLMVLIMVVLIISVVIPILGRGLPISKATLNNFDSKKVSVKAISDKQNLENYFETLSLDQQGFKQVADEFIDGCFTYNNGGNSGWQKVCYGQRILYLGSNKSVNNTEGYLVNSLNNDNLQLEPPEFYNKTCYGFSDGDIFNADGGGPYNLEYQVSSIKSGCKVSTLNNLTDQLASEALTPQNGEAPNLSGTIYSSLTQRANTSSVVTQLRNEGYSSFIVLEVVNQYFDQPIGLHLSF